MSMDNSGRHRLSEVEGRGKSTSVADPSFDRFSGGQTVAEEHRAEKRLRLLIVAHAEDDVPLLVEGLERSGFEVGAEIVNGLEEMKKALKNRDWDAVFSGVRSPELDALGALALVQDDGSDLPFIMFVDKTGEESAIEVMKAGAHDYVTTDDLGRLGPALDRELKQANIRRALRRTEGALFKREEGFRDTFEQAGIGAAHVGFDGRWLEVNKKLCETVGFAESDLRGSTMWEVPFLDDFETDQVHLDQLLAHEVNAYATEKRYLRGDGSIGWADLTFSLACGGPYPGAPKHFVTIIEDITERKRRDEVIRQSEALHRAAVQQSAECIFLLDADTKRVLESNAAFQRLLGYTAEELRTMDLYGIAAHDRSNIDWNIEKALETEDFSASERLYRCKDGRLVEVEAKVGTVHYGDRNVLCVIARNVPERNWTEESLLRNLDVLLALREAGQILSSTLESDKVASKLLEIMRGVSNLVAAVISVKDDQGEFRIWRASGLDGLWRRARYAPQAEAARQAALETGGHQLFWLPRPGSATGYLAGLCLPLRVQNRVTGVLEAYGPANLIEDNEAADILDSLAVQAASALENARLYGELAERERQLEDLVGKLITAQEEERRHVAHEVHDGLAQLAVAAHQRLQAFAQRYPSAPLERGEKDLDRILSLVRQTVSEARRVIASLRPTVLDDLGLEAAIRLEAEGLRGIGWQVDYAERLGDKRLSTTVETALYRIAQEALTNARKHGQTDRARLLLDLKEDAVVLEVQDWGRGFDPAILTGGKGPGERVGLSGMRERMSMIGGELEVRSGPGEGTLVSARVPLPKAEIKGSRNDDPTVGDDPRRTRGTENFDGAV